MIERGPAIVLIGFMGAGKSSAGRALAKKLGWPRFDTDEMVSARMGLSIPEIFARWGEEAFRAEESETLREIPSNAPAIIVTGGGIVLRPENVHAVRRLGRVIYLEADEETLFRRISRRATRPLLQTENPRQTVAELLGTRGPLYRAAAHAELDTSRLSHEEMAEAILKIIETL